MVFPVTAPLDWNESRNHTGFSRVTTIANSRETNVSTRLVFSPSVGCWNRMNEIFRNVKTLRDRFRGWKMCRAHYSKPNTIQMLLYNRTLAYSTVRCNLICIRSIRSRNDASAASGGDLRFSPVSGVGVQLVPEILPKTSTFLRSSI